MNCYTRLVGFGQRKIKNRGLLGGRWESHSDQRNGGRPVGLGPLTDALESHTEGNDCNL